MFLSRSQYAYKLTVRTEIQKIITRHASGRYWVGWDKPRISNEMNETGEGEREREKEITKEREITLIHGKWENIKEQNFIVVNKPSGVPIKDQDPSVDSLERRVAKHIQFHNREYASKLYFPHSIDKWSSGLVVVALTQTAFTSLLRSHENNLWLKKFHLLSVIPSCLLGSKVTNEGGPVPKSCMICSPSLVGELVTSCKKCSHLHTCSCKPDPKTSKREYLLSRLKPKGVLKSNIATRTKDNSGIYHLKASLTGKEIVEETEEEENYNNYPTCNACSPALKLKEKHPFVARHLLNKSVPLNDPEGRPTSTHFSLVDMDLNSGNALYELTVNQDRKHQLRIHFADAGFPVVGDPYYNPFVVQQLHLLKSPRNALFTNAKGFNTKRGKYDQKIVKPQEIKVEVDMCLQASGLSFPDPERIGKSLSFNLPIPNSWNFNPSSSSSSSSSSPPSSPPSSSSSSPSSSEKKPTKIAKKKK